DQFVNCNYFVKIWRIGVRISGFGLKDVEENVKRVMEDDEMKQRLIKLNDNIMGKVACSAARSNMTYFTDDLRKVAVESPIGKTSAT
ncbi:unnamed protein product, partial [Ilex paraguariensis]